ncbi:MAG: hypothetical protein VB046_08210 [Paludibacter sp.]|nr:hypothetical protein [Paludibacter sp.]
MNIKNEINIEQWVEISWYIFESGISIQNQNVKECHIHTIDIPRSMLDRWRWLIDWRTSKYKYLNPRKNVQHWYCYYDKKTGFNLAYNSTLIKLISAKAQVTKVQNAIEKYKDEMSKTLFFDMQNDVIYRKLIIKLNEKKQNFCDLQIELEKEKPIK